MKKSYVPDRGDIVWLNFAPQAGRGQMGRRPALVMSYRIYNEKTNLAIVCPIMGKIKGYPFEVILDARKIDGAVLSDQVRNLDWKEGEAEYIEKAGVDVIDEVADKIKALILD